MVQSRTVRIVNFDENVTADRLKKFICLNINPRGNILRLYIRRDDELNLMYAFVVFETTFDAEKADHLLNGCFYGGSLLDVALIGPTREYRRYHDSPSESNNVTHSVGQSSYRLSNRSINILPVRRNPQTNSYVSLSNAHRLKVTIPNVYTNSVREDPLVRPLLGRHTKVNAIETNKRSVSSTLTATQGREGTLHIANNSFNNVYRNPSASSNNTNVRNINPSNTNRNAMVTTSVTSNITNMSSNTVPRSPSVSSTSVYPQLEAVANRSANTIQRETAIISTNTSFSRITNPNHTTRNSNNLNDTQSRAVPSNISNQSSSAVQRNQYGNPPYRSSFSSQSSAYSSYVSNYSQRPKQTGETKNCLIL